MLFPPLFLNLASEDGTGRSSSTRLGDRVGGMLDLAMSFKGLKW